MIHNRFILGALIWCYALGHIAAAAAPFDPIYQKWHVRIDKAVEAGFEYLERMQHRDGSFPAHFGESTGIPALVGMAFLSKGYLPTGHRYSGTINRCIDYVLHSQKENGLFERGFAGEGPMYAHNISTLFLSEVSGMVDQARQERIQAALPQALALILRAQAVPKNDHHRGGWRYHPNSDDSDTSCTGWALMALRSAKLNGAAIPDAAIRDAVSYLKRHQHPENGGFGYQDQEHNAITLTGMGLLCLELAGLHGSNESRRAADFVRENFRKLPEANFEFYGVYYNAQAMFQMGGRYWQEYANWMYEHYLSRQSEDGSWATNEAGPVYGTAMTILSFTVPYRQLPIYERDETIDEL